MSKTYEAAVMQFLLPDGRRKPTNTQLPVETQDAYNDMLQHGCRFEAEVLRNGRVSVTIANDEDDVDISITVNGPEVQNGMVKMLFRGAWRQEVA